MKARCPMDMFEVTLKARGSLPVVVVNELTARLKIYPSSGRTNHMDILVNGGDGFVGQRLCAELVDRGHTVTSLSRSPDPEVLPDEVETVTGDVTDYDSIEGTFEGKNVAVNLTALPPLHQPHLPRYRLHWRCSKRRSRGK